MSLLSTWVQATDGKFYKNPVLFGDDWFICFDEDEPPEIIIAQSDKQLARSAAQFVLTEAGFKAKDDMLRYSCSSMRMFPPSGSLRQSIAFFFDISSRIPIPRKYDDISETKPLMQCVYYEFPE